MNHDPLCSAYGALFWRVDITGKPFPCDCELIARVVERMRVGWDADVEWANKLLDERDKARTKVAALLASNEGLRQRVDTLVRLHDEALAEIAALQQAWVNLRAKVLAEKVDDEYGVVTGEWDAAMEKVIDIIDGLQND